MPTLTGFFQLIQCAPGNHFAPVTNKGFQHLFKIERAWLAIFQRHHVNPEHVLQLRLSKQVIDHYFAGLTTLDFNHHAQTIFIRLIAQFGDAFNLLLFHQLGDLLDQPRLIHLIRQLGDDDVVATGFVVVLNGVASAHINTSTACTIRRQNARAAIDNGTGGEVRPGDILHQVIYRQRVVVDEGQTAVNHFTHIVRWNIGRHTYRDTRRAVNEQVGYLGG